MSCISEGTFIVTFLIKLTDLHSVLQRYDLLLLLLQQAVESFHVLQRQLQHHSLFQMAQRL